MDINKLNTEIEKSIEKLNSVEADEYRDYAEGIAKLIDAETKYKEAMANIENQETVTANAGLAQDVELGLKEKESKWNTVKIVSEIGLGLSALGFTVWSTIKGFKFEETGTITSKTFQRILNKGIKIK